MSEFEKFSKARKEGVKNGTVPDWYQTQGLIMFTRKYAYNNETVKESFERVAKQLASHIPTIPEAEMKFFDLMWRGYLAPSTPVLANTGTDRGQSVSCAGQYVSDSVDSFYMNYHEAAMLSKNGYGTSAYLGDIRARGSRISSGGKADGVVPVFDSFVDMADKISQGGVRRASWAGYLPIDHGDFFELAGYVQKHPASAHVGWNITDEFIDRLKSGDKDAVERWNRMMYLRARTGKGYIWKPDTANRLAPEPIKNCGVTIKASNLCSEISLPQNQELTYSCCLSSLNLAKWDEFETDTIFWSVVFLDCVVSEMLMKAKGKPGFERIVRFTEQSRALGLGALGFHSYLQSHMIGFEELEAQFLNQRIFKKIHEEALKATLWLGEKLGEPEWCKGTGRRNATLEALAPNMSSALLCGGMSQGIEPLIANAYQQGTAAGEMTRMNPYFVELVKKKGKYSEALMRDLAINYDGSVQHLDWLSEHEKLVFKTAFEINQHVIVRLASQRQKYIEQGQSLNLFFTSDEEYIAEVTKEALLDPNIKGLYYQRSLRGVKGSKGDNDECVSCSG